MTQISPYARHTSSPDSFWYMGALFTFLSTAEDTNGQFMLVEALGQPGGEPAPHTHSLEDEAYYVLEGSLEFWVGDEHLMAPAGTYVYLPRNVRHSWKIHSVHARLLIMCWPAGLEGYFKEFAEPAKQLVLPPLPDPASIDMERFIERGRAYGIEFHLPQYAGGS